MGNPSSAESIRRQNARFGVASKPSSSLVINKMVSQSSLKSATTAASDDGKNHAIETVDPGVLLWGVGSQFDGE
ncbi:hypothetical protein PRK78_007498 [Emydomyces testavorans]|uniref:Uncharacterized protein n=1 Tax=Emydomyces testavorans TaxID=2070801 RepID=A0AAF0DPG4_9EURO|nr:hypothetical protein PRK78_007498 [Emydomyces testavorans]